MHPALVVLGTAAGGFGLYKLYERFVKPSGPGQGAPVSQMKKGAYYGVTLAVSPALQSAVGADGTQVGPRIDAASAAIKATFDQTGMTVLQMPQPKTQADSAAFLGGQVSAWVFLAMWNVDAPYFQGEMPAWSGQVVVQPAMGTGAGG